MLNGSLRRQREDQVGMSELCVLVLTLLSEAHIWDRVTLGAQVGGSSGGDGEGDGLTGDAMQEHKIGQLQSI